MIYDYIIIGAGLGGLSAGINLSIHNKKVLILEKNTLPGGLATTLKKGRFEFDTSIHELYNYGNDEHSGSLKEILEKYGIEINTKVIENNVAIHVMETNDNFTITGGIEEFFLELEKLKNNSVEPLKKFLRVIKEIHDTYLELLEDNSSILDDSTFNKYLTMSAIDGMLDLGIPKETIDRLGYLWLYLGSPLNKLSFIDFAVFMYQVIFKKTCVLEESNLNFVLKLVNRYQDLGGKIYYRTKVTNIKEEENLKIVHTKDHKTYKAKEIICDVSKRYVFSELMNQEYKEINRLENARTSSFTGLIVYLGLNKDKEFLKLDHYHYYEFQTRKSEANLKNMSNLYTKVWEAIVPNVENENASPKNTTIIILKATYASDAFKEMNLNNEAEMKEKLAQDLIEQFENTFQIDIKEYIEEIEITTPLTIKRKTNNMNGAMKGYMRKGYDNMINRLLAYPNEEVKGIHFVGGSSIFGGGVHNVIYSGYYITNQILKKKNREEEEKNEKE